MKVLSFKNEHKVKRIFYVSFSIFLGALLASVLLLFFEPRGFDARRAILPLLLVLCIGGIGIGYSVCANSTKLPIKLVGIASIAVLLTFIGFFIVAGVAWCTALAHANDVL